MALAEAIEEVPVRIRNYVMKEYVRQVNLINNIYFYSDMMVKGST